MAFPTTPTNGQQITLGGVLYEYDSSLTVWRRMAKVYEITANTFSNITVSGNIVSGNIIPGANVTYDLGSPSRRWRDLYMSGNTIYLGSSVFTQSNGSVVIIPPPTVEFPNPTGMVISPYGTISTVTTSNGNVTGSVTASNISSFSNITVTDQATVGNLSVSNVTVSGNVIQNGWKTYATASKLTIYYNSSPLFTIYTNGNIVAAGDVQAYGSP